MPLPMWPCTLPLGTSTPRGVRGRKKTEKTKTRKFQSWVGGNKASKKGGNMLLIILHIIWFFVFLFFFHFFFSSFFFFPHLLQSWGWGWGLGLKKERLQHWNLWGRGKEGRLVPRRHIVYRCRNADTATAPLTPLSSYTLCTSVLTISLVPGRYMPTQRPPLARCIPHPLRPPRILAPPPHAYPVSTLLRSS